MFIPDFDIDGWIKEGSRINQEKIMIQINPNKLIDYTIMHARVVVTHVSFYDILIGGMVLYPLRLTIIFWEETKYY
jgi:hypothetical protein